MPAAPDQPKPTTYVRICGCFYCESEQEARWLMRAISAFGGYKQQSFTANHITEREDGSEISRPVQAQKDGQKA